jgi:hypothetical protein
MAITEKERFMKYRMDAMEKRLDMMESLWMQHHVQPVKAAIMPPISPSRVPSPVVPEVPPECKSQEIEDISVLVDPMSMVRRRFIL